MQLYCNYMQLGVAISTLCNFMMDRCGNLNFMQLNETMQLCNMQLVQLQQLYGTYATLRNFMQLYATYATMQLCNYMQLYDG